MENPIKKFKDRLEEKKLIAGLSQPVFTETKAKELTERDIVNKVWYSFMFSQGSYPLQFALLNNLFYKNGPQLHLDREDLIRQFKERLLSKKPEDNGSKFLRITNSKMHSVVDSDEMYLTMNDESKIFGPLLDAILTNKYSFQLLFNNDLDETGERTSEEAFINEETDFKSVNFIISSIVELDYKFLIEQSGRKNRLSQNVGSDDLKDKYLSFVVVYLMRETKIQEPDFDDMFKTLRKYWEIYCKRSSYETRKRINDVIQRYNETHEDKVDMLRM